LALGVAGALTTAISLLRFSVDGVEDSIANLYALPVALVALTFGRRAGLMAGVAATGLLLWWVLAADQHLTPLGWTSRVMPLVLLGGLVGDAADRVRSVDRTERHARALEALGRDTAELHDSLLQHLAVAKWRLESGDTEHSLDSITEAMADGQELIRQLLGSDSVLPGDRRRSLPATPFGQAKRSMS
jgi:signal transduction histidine kinase